MPTTEELPNELRDKNWLITDTQISAQQKNRFLCPKNVAKNVEDVDMSHVVIMQIVEGFLRKAWKVRVLLFSEGGGWGWVPQYLVCAIVENLLEIGF